MAATKVYNGQLITSTATEQDLQPDGISEAGNTLLVKCEVVSGTIKFGVGRGTDSPVIDGDLGTWGSYTTSNTDAYRTVIPGKNNLRCVGVGTFIISW
jgi:hypothetical protein